MQLTEMNRVRAGLDFLEAWGTPKGRGVDSIDVARLNMDSTIDDILGQLHGVYSDGRDVLGLDAEMAWRLGFDFADGEDPQALTIAWRVLLRGRAARKAAA